MVLRIGSDFLVEFISLFFPKYEIKDKYRVVVSTSALIALLTTVFKKPVIFYL